MEGNLNHHFSFSHPPFPRSALDHAPPHLSSPFQGSSAHKTPRDPHRRPSPPPSWLCGTPSSPSSPPSSQPPSPSSPVSPSSPWRQAALGRAGRTALAAPPSPPWVHRGAGSAAGLGPVLPGRGPPPARAAGALCRPGWLSSARLGSLWPRRLSSSSSGLGLRRSGELGLRCPGSVRPAAPGRGFNPAPHATYSPPAESEPLFVLSFCIPLLRRGS